MKRALLLAAALAALAPAPGFAQPQPPTAASAPVADFEAQARALLEANYSADEPGAAVLVARGDRVLFRAARGLADMDRRTPLSPDHLFRIGSVTKQFAAAGLLKLVEHGKVRLDDPLTKYLPGYPGGERITVEMLLNHTSGVKSYTEIDGYMTDAVRHDRTTAEMIAVFRDLPADFEPGTRWNYNNSGYVLVGAVIEAASGMPWHQWLEQSLFRPLGMRDTGYGHDPRWAARQVRGFSSLDGKTVTDPLPMSMTQPHAAGALLSTVDDLLKWNRALHEGRVLSDATYRRMITPVGPAADPAIGYGFGIYAGTVRNRPALRHNGGIFGFASSLYYLPGPDITVVVLENDDVSNPRDSADTLVRKLAAMALGDPYPAPTPIPVDPAALTAAEGLYRFDGGVVRILRVVDGKLTAQRGNGPRTPLIPIATDEFLYDNGFDRIRLERDAGGRITGARFFARGEGDGLVGVRADEALPSTPIGLQLPLAVLERLAGVYVRDGLTLTVSLEGDALKAQLAGQEAFRLRASSPTRFHVDESGATLDFPTGDAQAAEVTIRQGAREVVLRRKP